MYKKRITRPVPADAVVVTPDKVRVRSNRKWVERDLNASGRMLCESKCYYGRVRQPNGTLREVKLTPDKVSSEQILAALRLKAARIKAGLEMEPNPQRFRSLKELAEEWFGEMRRAGRNPGHIRTVRSRVLALIRQCGFETPADIANAEASQKIAAAFISLAAPRDAVVLPKGEHSFSPLQLRTLLAISPTAIAKLARNRGIKPTGKGKAARYTREQAELLVAHRALGAAPNTMNGFRTSMRAFSQWLVRNGIIEKSPPMPMRVNEKKDRRRVRRAITWAECLQLVDCVKKEGKTRGGMSAKERAVLYQIAFVTLLRARALRELKPTDCDLSKNPCFIVVRSETDKTGKSRSLPINPDLGSQLSELLAIKKINKPIWAIPKNMSDVLRQDLISAKLDYRNEQGVFDFHAFRHSGATHLAKNGVRLDIVARIGGWSNLNQFYERYSHYSVSDLALATMECWPCTERTQ